MDNDMTDALGGRLRLVRLPRWDELPGFGLYLDQILTWLAQHLGGSDGGERQLTASMVNNYVKMGAIPAPERKKYFRPQLAQLIVVSILKPVLSISDIRDFLSSELRVEAGGELYDGFCEMYEQANSAALREAEQAARSSQSADLMKEALVRSALRACAERSIARAIISGDAARGLPDEAAAGEDLKSAAKSLRREARAAAKGEKTRQSGDGRPDNIKQLHDIEKDLKKSRRSAGRAHEEALGSIKKDVGREASAPKTLRDADE